MTQTERFNALLHEFERVGVDPNTISAGLSVRSEDVLDVLRALPDGAGPAAFLARLREITHPSDTPPSETGGAPRDHAAG